ncbi:ABC transporter ATP-binding protein [Pseudomonas aeruginosa VRFPA02]|nr:ABC transporter ATP-binding protein [Pseudomonas aeruginosa VRFPA02]
MIRLEKVNKWYGAYHALADVDEQVGRGEVVVVCGPSGSGKSTLIRTLNRLEPIQGGRILIDGQDIHAPGLDLNRFRSHIGFVFQQFNLFPHLNVLDNCTLAPLRLRGLKPAEARSQAMALLERVGLADKAAAFPARLSGGPATAPAGRSARRPGLPAYGCCPAGRCRRPRRSAGDPPGWWPTHGHRRRSPGSPGSARPGSRPGHPPARRRRARPGRGRRPGRWRPRWPGSCPGR